MPDEQTTPEQGGAQSGETPAIDSSNGVSVSRRRPPSGRSAGWWAIRVMLIILVLIIGSFVCLIDIILHPDSGPEGFKVRCITNTTGKHLSEDPNVVSITVINASADIGGTEADLDMRLKDDASADTVADPLTSTHTAAFGKNSPDTNINLYVTLSWTLHDANIKTTYDYVGRPDLLHTARQGLTTTGEARTIDITGGRLNIDYEQITAVPTTFLQPGAPRSTKTFTMNEWRVTSTSNANGQFDNSPFDQLITAAEQASPTGAIDLDNGTLSVTGLVTDDIGDLASEAAIPVTHTIAGCQSTGLTTLQLNSWTVDINNVTDPWLTFTCDDGAWTPQHNDSTGQDEAIILNKAAEL